jgi:DNA adenine methylase
MKYMGSKNRIAKHILPIMLADRKPEQWWVEPFVGGANIIDKVKGNRMGGDSNKYLIALLKELQTQVPFNPPHIGEKEYNDIKKNKEQYPDWLVGYAGFNLSFAAKFFGGYRRDKAGLRNYENEAHQNRLARQNLLAQQNLLVGVNFVCSDYRDIALPSNSIIYCDPPYKGTTKYKDGINHEDFWQWCREKAIQGHIIYVSEYIAPDDFECVWLKDVGISVSEDAGNKRATEKLFKCRYRK